MLILAKCFRLFSGLIDTMSELWVLLYMNCDCYSTNAHNLPDELPEKEFFIQLLCLIIIAFDFLSILHRQLRTCANFLLNVNDAWDDLVNALCVHAETSNWIWLYLCDYIILFDVNFCCAYHPLIITCQLCTSLLILFLKPNWIEIYSFHHSIWYF